MGYIIRHFGLFYTFLRRFLAPYVPDLLPRYVTVFGHKYRFITANRVTYFRTALVLPYAILLIGYPITAFTIFVIASLLDFVDGLVAMVQRKKYRDDPRFIAEDNPIYGAFIDAFCDKVFWVLATVAALPHLRFSTLLFDTLMWSMISILMIIEVFLGIIRVQDYFATKYDNVTRAVKAGKSGKLKFALEVCGLGGLILSHNTLDHWAGFLGIDLLALAIPFGIRSLINKLRAR